MGIGERLCDVCEVNDDKVDKDLLKGKHDWLSTLYPMSVAIKSQSVETVRVLLAAGVSVSGLFQATRRNRRVHQSMAGKSMFTWAVECSTLEVVAELLQHLNISTVVKVHTSPFSCPLHAAGTQLTLCVCILC